MSENGQSIIWHGMAKTSVLIHLSTEQSKFVSRSSPFLLAFLVCQRLVSFGRSVHTVRTFSADLLRLVGNGTFRDLLALSGPASRRRYVVSEQYVGDAGQRVLLLRAICICEHFCELVVAYLHVVCVGCFVVCLVCFVSGLFLRASPQLRSSPSTAVSFTRCSLRYLNCRN